MINFDPEWLVRIKQHVIALTGDELNKDVYRGVVFTYVCLFAEGKRVSEIQMAINFMIYEEFL
ncbi:hypothetical protein C1Y35_20730 [Pseudomonas sp. GW456-L14]|nr:hypothetical protein C1Y35_20730 [Pseudomonas sp. GW456-L14]PMY53212.1 hypothetical protein C1Y34_19885 [Pseudomonas sp. GW456-L12]